ncbi:hypothetical protein DPX16_21552 [Anabarilius grahami]|uniref:Uncharacterized protein n=1 Tax=Anabarilius grahami TaxID=495550 RepID=A0A3N0XV39_ANAGA|nr:hypothetical protein DPX16_21552 [Anabarilius grahami]
MQKRLSMNEDEQLKLVYFILLALEAFDEYLSGVWSHRAFDQPTAPLISILLPVEVQGWKEKHSAMESWETAVTYPLTSLFNTVRAKSSEQDMNLTGTVLLSEIMSVIAGGNCGICNH